MQDIAAAIKAVCPRARADIVVGISSYWQAAIDAGINTTIRQAHFLAQLAHESADFKTTEEYASGEAYEGRRDLGNVRVGDGKLFKGRGLIQCTGRANYRAFDEAEGTSTIIDPASMGRFPNALLSAVWFWTTHKLNTLADTNNIETITRKINGGLNGFAQRKAYYSKFLTILAAQDKKDGTLAVETKVAAKAQADAHTKAAAKNTAAVVAAPAVGGPASVSVHDHTTALAICLVAVAAVIVFAVVAYNHNRQAAKLKEIAYA